MTTTVLPDLTLPDKAEAVISEAPFNATTLTVVLIVGLCTSCILILYLWCKRKNGFLWKLFWTFVLFLPYIGPILYWGLYKPPPPKKKEDQLTDDKVSIY